MTAPTSREWLRAAAQRLTLGSRRLTTHLGRRVAASIRDTWARTMAWLSDATGLAWAVRLCVLLAAAWVLRRIGVSVATAAARRLDSSPWLLWPALGLWVIASWRAGHPDWRPRPSPAAAEEPEPEPESEPEPVSLAKEHPAGPSIDDIVAAARKLGTPHVHLAAIEEHLGAPQGTARRLLAAAGIPISDVRMHGRGTSTGVRGSDIPPFSHPSSEPADDVVGAGQDANNDNNNADRVEKSGGLLIVRRPSEDRHYPVAKTP
ncbi:hypothetical protein ACFVHW_07055 [Streptomyces sp. NPDC127110]|uniref:hypothetical protein n=1 Tax=Streptomyces sp. NPDC127110 TaxID=3345362 RepID=UPI00362E19D5